MSTFIAKWAWEAKGTLRECAWHAVLYRITQTVHYELKNTCKRMTRKVLGCLVHVHVHVHVGCLGAHMIEAHKISPVVQLHVHVHSKPCTNSDG